mmetsp:Transcript_5859/g.24841  ORF Transcript_5859/g.24841 Transcript_5859/m.24841 type:complete len:238 (+) Transcript_5859:1235-1948(+)
MNATQQTRRRFLCVFFPLAASPGRLLAAFSRRRRRRSRRRKSNVRSGRVVGDDPIVATARTARSIQENQRRVRRASRRRRRSSLRGCRRARNSPRGAGFWAGAVRVGDVCGGVHFVRSDAEHGEILRQGVLFVLFVLARRLLPFTRLAFVALAFVRAPRAPIAAGRFFGVRRRRRRGVLARFFWPRREPNDERVLLLAELYHGRGVAVARARQRHGRLERARGRLGFLAPGRRREHG